MTATSSSRGNRLTYNEETDKYYYDDGTEYQYNDKVPCANCGEAPTKEGHDACLGTLKGVEFACCGHGVEPGYVVREGQVRPEVLK